MYAYITKISNLYSTIYGKANSNSVSTTTTTTKISNLYSTIYGKASSNFISTTTTTNNNTILFITTTVAIIIIINFHQKEYQTNDIWLKWK